MDSIFIRGLVLDAQVGLLDWEQTTTQPIVMDCELAIPSLQQAAQTNDLAHSVDYAQVYETICSFVANNRFLLLETMADELATQLLALATPASAVTLSIAKTTIFEAAESAGVRICRQRESCGKPSDGSV